MAKSNKATASQIDFTNVKDGGNFNKKRQPEGDYLAKVTKVQDAPTKDGGEPQWLFTIEVGTGTYAYYCKLVENQYWKVRNLLVAAGVSVPKKRVKVDPNVVVGKMIGVTLEDDEYNGKPQSNIAATFPRSELDSDRPAGADEDLDDDGEEAKPKKNKKGSKAEKVEAAKAEVKGKAKKGKKKAAADLDEIDIDDV